MKMMLVAILALASAPVGADAPSESFLLVVKLAHDPANLGRALRVTVVETRAECERLGAAIVATANEPRSSKYYCHKGKWRLGPRTSGYASGGYLLKNIEQRR
ncbi:hypothetical protein V5F89_12550 [Pelagerythrobacter marensis]|uniref:UrcA family protein n=1 Tax=Pelagerythrobacter marensis TaxID=543877 RepID=A0ABZ2D217_9SPHN